MNIALIGYGKMGKEVEKILLSRSHTVLAIIDSESDWNEQYNELLQCHVAIEFSTPDTVLKNMLHCFDLKIPIVVGTTGWHQHLNEIKEECKNRNAALFTASNFSIGVNLFFELNKFLAKLMEKYPSYEVEMTEIHHAQKLDSPSGTAIALANDIIHTIDHKNDWALHEKKSEKDLVINSLREGDVTGTHSISYVSEVDIVEIKHEAKSRKGFALGAVLAAEFLSGKTGYYEMKDLLQF